MASHRCAVDQTDRGAWARERRLSRSSQAAVTVLVLLPGSAGTHVVAADLLPGPGERWRCRRRWWIVGSRGPRLLIIGVLVAHIRHRGRLLDGLDILRGLDPHREHDLDDVLLDAVEHVGEKLEGFPLVFLLRVLLRIAAQVYA